MALPSTGTIEEAPGIGYHGDLRGGVNDVRGGLVTTAALAAGRLALYDGVGPNGEANVKGIEDSDTVDAESVAGFAIRDEFKAEADYGVGRQLEIARQGRMLATATASVTARNPVYIGNTTATLNQIKGATDTGFVLLPGARWQTTTGAGELGIIEFDFRP